MAEERVQRRLAAILAADVVGYSRMMAHDESGTLARLKSLRAEFLDPKIAEYSGRIVKTMGDGALIEFGSAVDAVSHAVDVQHGMAERNARLPKEQQIQLRLGINVGDVIIDGDDIYGDGVNVAARLEALAEPGGICISARVHEYVGDRLDIACDDLGRQAMKNIAEPVHVYRVRLADAVRMPVRDIRAPLPLHSKPSIAVLPFQNMSGDADQEYFSDGITEDIITALSRIRQFFVIARNTTFTYKGQAVNVQAVAKDLGVRYVLEGSVRKVGNRVRITAQLIDGDSGHHLWADKYDRQLEGIFEVQDEITQTVVGAISPELDRAERNRAVLAPPENLDAWDYLYRGRWELYKFDTASNSQAQDYFRQSIELDPSFAPAYAALAEAKFVGFFAGLSGSPADELNQGLDAARAAVAFDDKDAVAHAILGVLHLVRREHTPAFEALQRALAINPSSANAHHWLGLVYAFDGRSDEAVAEQEIATRLSPNDPRLWAFMTVRAYAYLNASQFDQAAEWASRALRQPNAPRNPYIVQVIALSKMGRAEELQRATETLLQVSPAASITNIRESIPFNRPEDVELWVDGLREAGLPE